jgi:hypothetical protein
LQSVPAATVDDTIVSGLPQIIAGIREDSAFRTNLILTNAAEDPLEVQVKLVAETGSVLANRWVHVPPLGMTQLTRVVRALGVDADVSGGQIVLSPVPGGYLAAYAALIDNTTNDPRTLLPQRATGSWLLRSSARVHGLAGSYFTTDLVLANPGPEETQVTMKFLGNKKRTSRMRA